jgi:cell division septum initiation protein DivIVA
MMDLADPAPNPDDARTRGREDLERLVIRSAGIIERLQQQLDDANRRAAVASQSRPVAPVDSEAALGRALLLLQKTADEAVAEAEEQSRLRVEEAKVQAQEILGNAENRGREIVTRKRVAVARVLEQERARVEAATLTVTVALARLQEELRSSQERIVEALRKVEDNLDAATAPAANTDADTDIDLTTSEAGEPTPVAAGSTGATSDAAFFADLRRAFEASESGTGASTEAGSPQAEAEG